MEGQLPSFLVQEERAALSNGRFPIDCLRIEMERVCLAIPFEGPGKDAELVREDVYVDVLKAFSLVDSQFYEVDARGGVKDRIRRWCVVSHRVLEEALGAGADLALLIRVPVGNILVRDVLSLDRGRPDRSIPIKFRGSVQVPIREIGDLVRPQGNVVIGADLLEQKKQIAGSQGKRPQ